MCSRLPPPPGEAFKVREPRPEEEEWEGEEEWEEKPSSWPAYDCW